jgi:hypothetical protein
MDIQKILKIDKVSYDTSWHKFEMHRIYNTQPLSLTDSFEVAAEWIWGGSK